MNALIPYERIKWWDPRIAWHLNDMYLAEVFWWPLPVWYDRWEYIRNVINSRDGAVYRWFST